jgi:hypothetical protein
VDSRVDWGWVIQFSAKQESGSGSAVLLHRTTPTPDPPKKNKTLFKCFVKMLKKPSSRHQGNAKPEVKPEVDVTPITVYNKHIISILF